MQTTISEKLLNTPEGQEANDILRACVHCGFCTATCPTYQLLGDELDGPRGRIYLIKQVLEGQSISTKTQTHLDRCLTCRACETTCPSGVRYARLADIGRALVEKQIPRSTIETLKRRMLRALIPFPNRLSPLLALGQFFKPLLPLALKRKIPPRQKTGPRPRSQHARKMLLLEGCAQRALTPHTNEACARVLDRLGIQVIEAPGAGCCGALSHHLSAHEEALHFMRRNIDAWWPAIENGAEAVIITASGCATQVKDYADLLKHDPLYADKARRICALAKDISEVVRDEPLPTLHIDPQQQQLSFHSPCTLQHGQQLDGVVEHILIRAGFTLGAVADAHLCCGSAGTYSILQPVLSQQLLHNKISALEHTQPDIIVTANVGCQLHLQTATTRPVKHWIELMDAALNPRAG